LRFCPLASCTTKACSSSCTDQGAGKRRVVIAATRAFDPAHRRAERCLGNDQFAVETSAKGAQALGMAHAENCMPCGHLPPSLPCRSISTGRVFFCAGGRVPLSCERREETDAAKVAAIWTARAGQVPRRCVRSRTPLMPVVSARSEAVNGTLRRSRTLSRGPEYSAVAHTFSHQDRVRSTEPANYPPPHSGRSIR
jgi:hypothetical protein